MTASNALILGSINGVNGATANVNVGIGTTAPRSILEADVNAPNTLGPTFTLTNTGGFGGAAASIDLNSYTPSTTGTYNPAARIEALDDNFADDILFQANKQGAKNQGLITNVDIKANGLVGIGTTSPAKSLDVHGQILANEGLPSTTCGAGVGGYSFENDGCWDTGMFSPSDGVVDLITNATQTMTLQTGSVSISGNLSVSGQITAGTKDFKIDHPLHPAEKYLYHASVESSEMMNIYTGNATLDARGRATIQLPDWFEALNRDFRYELTSVGRPQPSLYIAKEVSHNRFQIAGGKPGGHVSWQVTGVRQDAYAKAYPVVVEENKPREEQGHYLASGALRCRTGASRRVSCAAASGEARSRNRDERSGIDVDTIRAMNKSGIKWTT